MRDVLVGLAAVVLIVVEVAAIYGIARWLGVVDLVKQALPFPEGEMSGWRRWSREMTSVFLAFVVISVPLHVVILVVFVIVAAISKA